MKTSFNTKIAIFAGEKPFSFIILAFLIIFITILILALVLFGLQRIQWVPQSPTGRAVFVSAIYMPVGPLFILAAAMLAERLLNTLRLGWIIGVDQWPILRFFQRLCGVNF